MRIHTDKITTLDVLHATQRAERISGAKVYVTDVTEHGSRKRDRAWNVTLTGDGTLSRRRVNYGTSRELDRFSRPYAATWEQWGWFIAHLFTVDPDAVVGPYDGREDFHGKTHDEFWIVGNV